MSQSTEESDGQRLERMGTDALKWAEEFIRIQRQIGHPPDVGGMIGWFASAIETGRTQGRRETCPHTQIVVLSGDLAICGVCGHIPQVAGEPQ